MAIPEWGIAFEIRLLEEILDELPEEEVIERIGFEHRLAEAKKQIARLSSQTQPNYVAYHPGGAGQTKVCTGKS